MAKGLSHKQGAGKRGKQETWAGYDAQQVKAAILSHVAGSWADVDPDAFLADLYRARGEGARQATRS